MFAIIESGGRQLRVEEGAVVTVDHLSREVGDTVTFDRVLFVDGDGTIAAGTPYIEQAAVTGVIDSQTRGPKLRVFRKRRRKAWRRTLGHRTAQTRVRITRIEAGQPA